MNPFLGMILFFVIIIGIPAGLSVAWDGGKFSWGEFFGMMIVIAFVSMVPASCMMMGKS